VDIDIAELRYCRRSLTKDHTTTWSNKLNFTGWWRSLQGTAGKTKCGVRDCRHRTMWTSFMSTMHTSPHTCQFLLR